MSEHIHDNPPAESELYYAAGEAVWLKYIEDLRNCGEEEKAKK